MSAANSDIPVVVTNDSHFTLPTEHDAHDMLLCIGTNATVDQQDRFKIDGDGYHVRSEQEMAALFPDNPEFVTNTQLIAEECDLNLEFGRQQLPAPNIPEGRDSSEYLAELCRKNLAIRINSDLSPALHDRLDYELDVLRQTGFTDYIYIVKEIADFAHERNIRMGVRGSAAASLVLYSLGVTDIDPVEAGLVFERFLNLERREMPDVDFDFADDRRDEMFRFAYERYGEDRVAQIITFGTLGAKAAVRDVGRALGISYADTDRVARLIPNALHVTLDDAIEQVAELREYMNTDPRVQRLMDTARQLEGVSRHASTHAAGVVIAREPAHRTRAPPAPLARRRDEHPDHPVRNGPGCQHRPPQDGLPWPLQPHHPRPRRRPHRRNQRRRPSTSSPSPTATKPTMEMLGQRRDLRRLPA